MEKIQNKILNSFLLILLFFAVLFAIFWYALDKIYWSDVPFEPPAGQQLGTPQIKLFQEDAGEWKFAEVGLVENVAGLPEQITVQVAYYQKALANQKIEEAAVYVYRFSSSRSAQKMLADRIGLKTCSEVREKESGVQLVECLPGGVWWASGNFLINIADSPRTVGLDIGAYDLVVCDPQGCAMGEFTVYAPKDLFAVYVDIYRARRPIDWEGSPKKAEPREFGYDLENNAYHGNLVVSGYAAVLTGWGSECKHRHDCSYVNFMVTSIENEDYAPYYKGEASPFLTENSIGLGCLSKDEVIWRYNRSDPYGLREYASTPELSRAILDSTEQDPITVKLEKFLLTGKEETTACYSHFAKIHLIK